jgi:hypothetical protein
MSGIEILNDRYDWIAKILDVTYVYSISWFEDWNFGRDGLYINSTGAGQITQLHCRLVNCVVRKGDELTAVVERLK